MEFGMALQVEKNFLDQNHFDKINSVIMGDDFPWYFNDQVTNEDVLNSYYTHTFVRDSIIKSKWFKILEELVKKLNCKGIVRMKVNSYPHTLKTIKHKYHVDYTNSHKGCLFYLNSNNGYNYFKEGDKTIRPEKNKAVFFDPSKEHCSSTCTDQQRRVTININYL